MNKIYYFFLVIITLTILYISVSRLLENAKYNDQINDWQNQTDTKIWARKLKAPQKAPESQRMEDIFSYRKRVLQLACGNIHGIVDLKRRQAPLKELLNFHSRIYNLDYEYFKHKQYRNRDNYF